MPTHASTGPELTTEPATGRAARPGGSGAARVIRIPDIAWIEIPGGPFVWQRGETRELPTFWIAKYPVTNAQYQCFIDDGGYDEPDWWTDLEHLAPEPSRWPQGNRPRTNLSWYECVAFCRWLNARLGLAGDSIRLPTELEWERAARGTDGRAYPWGDDYRSGLANVDEAIAEAGPWSLKQTTAVGVYPHGGTPEGIDDLAGNVWEWCLNKQDGLDTLAPDTIGAPRALRGGSWNYVPEGARADFRFGDFPGGRPVSGGFRLFSSVPIRAR
jgi:formylglycine-generating enzyme required for sulfatase activity